MPKPSSAALSTAGPQSLADVCTTSGTSQRGRPKPRPIMAASLVRGQRSEVSPGAGLETRILESTIVAGPTALCPPRGVQPMSPDQSVTHWLSLLQGGGDAAAAQRLW